MQYEKGAVKSKGLGKKQGAAHVRSAIYVIEPDVDRARYVTTVLDFLGYRTALNSQHLPDREARASSWGAAVIGSIEPGEALDRELTLINDELPLIVLSDSPAAVHLRRQARYSYHEVDFPIRHTQLNDVLRQLHSNTERSMAAITQASPWRFVGSSTPMNRVKELIRRVARFDSSVLILGESGSGKELVARTIHDSSPRCDQPFVAINCGAIAAELLESELFGHEKGAFTGAITTRKGRFEMAEGGTLFLDEIGDMSLPMQVKLLRVLQERVYERVGGNRSQTCNVRIIAATHRNLEAEIVAGNFREDLFYRLNVFPIDMPPLCERLADLPELIDEFTMRLARRGLETVTLSDGALRTLSQYSWPGNVRELANLVERLAILYPGGMVRVADLPAKYRNAASLEDAEDSLMLSGYGVSGVNQAEVAMLLPHSGLDLKDHLATVEANLIRQALLASDGIVAQAAKLLCLQRTTLVEKLRKYGIQGGLQLSEN